MMLRSVADAFSLAIAWIKRNRRVRSDGGVVRVNLGSALTVAPGWVNVDASLNALFAGAPTVVLRLLYKSSGSRELYTCDEYCEVLRTNRFVHHNFQYPLPFWDGSVAFAYSSHLLEHLCRDNGLRLLKEIHRILMPGGWTRICVPDLAHVLTLFAVGQRERALEYFFGNSRGGYFNRHQYMYDFEMLAALLRQSGFSEVLRRDFREGRVPDLHVLDNRPDETLFVEAQKAPSNLIFRDS